MARTKRLNVSFSGNAYDQLSELSDERGTTLSDTVRDAVALEKWVQDATREGGKLLVQDKTGVVREVVVR